MIRVLGIDPGSRYLGFGIVELGARVGLPAYVGHGVVRTDARQPLAHRLRQLHDALTDVVATFRPDVVAVEGVFTHKNARSALTRRRDPRSRGQAAAGGDHSRPLRPRGLAARIPGARDARVRGPAHGPLPSSHRSLSPISRPASSPITVAARTRATG